MRPSNITLYCLPLVLLLMSGFQSAKPVKISLPPEPVWLQVLTRQGDDVPRLLARYGLEEFECNVTQFFKI
ncbi:MAG TPA: hypothetical protein PKL15_21330, partial [Saprospiraceae bacterium]|nr:hypothetical protein [Saprospiraceae bacterium]